MAVDAYSALSFAEVGKRLAPDRTHLAVAEVLAEDNPIMDHAIWKEANDTVSNREARRLSLATPTWRKVNQGVGVGSSRTIPVNDTIGMCEIYSEVDVEIIRMFKDQRQARQNEAMAMIEGMKIEFVATLLYGSTRTTPEEMNGFMTRMSSLATTNNVLNAGGSGSTTCSVLVVMWHPGKVFMVYPRGSNAGITHEDKGQVTKSTSTTAIASAAQFEAFRDFFSFKSGLVIKDDRAIGRIANIASTGTSNIFDEDDLITLLNRMPAGRKWIYVPVTVATQMQIALKDKNNVNFTPGGGEGLAGDPITRFMQHPVYKIDQMTITETAIS